MSTYLTPADGHHPSSISIIPVVGRLGLAAHEREVEPTSRLHLIWGEAYAAIFRVFVEIIAVHDLDLVDIFRRLAIVVSS